MRLLASLLLLPLAACPSPTEGYVCPEPTPIWEIAVSDRDFGVELGSFAATADGGAILAIGDWTGAPFELDGQTLTGAHLAAIDASGAITALVRAPELDGHAIASVSADGADGPIVVAGMYDELRLVAFDHDLQARWQLDDPEVNSWSLIDVAPSGEIALWGENNPLVATAPETAVRLLERDGTERWRVQLPDYRPAALRIADNGDVLVDGNTPARYAAADGALAAARPGPSAYIARDGTSIRLDPQALWLRDAGGNVIWAAALDGDAWNPSILPDGNVLTSVNVEVARDRPGEHWESYVVELDGRTGLPVGEVEHCGSLSPLAPTLDRYLTWSSAGFAMYPRPGATL